MDKIRVGVIGTGGIAVSTHLPAYAEQKDRVEIVALCDIDKVKLDKAVNMFGAAHAFTDYKEMLKMSELDAVSVCTPNYLHAPVTIAALEAGKHVLCEKPLAMNATEAQAMAEAAKKSGKIFMVGVNNRYRVASRKLKSMIEKGELGEIYAARTGWVRRRGVPFWGDWFMEKAKAGGGPLIDIGVHMLDLTRWLMGNPRPISVSGAIYHKIGDYRVTEWNMDDPVLAAAVKTVGDDKIYDVEDSAFAFIRFEGGMTMELNASWALNIEREIMYSEIYGTKAGAKLFPLPLTIYSEHDGNLTDTIIKTSEPKDSHWIEIEHFVDCIIEGRQPMSPGYESVEVMKILDALYQSAATGKEVRLDV